MACHRIAGDGLGLGGRKRRPPDGAHDIAACSKGAAGVRATRRENYADRRGEEGFTLLELLIAMTLLGLLMALLFGGLRFGARAWEHSEAHTTGMDDVRLAQAFIRSEIEQAYPLLVLTDPIHPHMDFEGGTEALVFLAPAPTSIAAAGRARIDLRVVDRGSRSMLVVRARPELAWDDDRDAIHEESLLAGVRSLRFSYFGSDSPGASRQWQERWTNRFRLPELIRVAVEFGPGDTRVWPTLVVAPRIAVDVNCLYDPLTKGCRGR